ncbi:MAG: hypothetical protein F6J89_19250 [Symploca sp. SIO1C4]|uniref:Methyltransferase domain-containing protein n=1 Tax=Symploca sp. SIO1C4 TaxID=2607765 RepID=A0A6B3N9B6_9CYAN|nr:hypothetical protein [Symploca sp. SIO1C4]
MITQNKSIKQSYLEYLNTITGIRNYTNFKTTLYSPNDTLVQEIIQKLPHDFSAVTFEASKRLKICDIGGGDGNRMFKIIQYLSKQFDINCQLDFIEQSLPFCQKFENLCKSNKELAETRIHNDLFEKIIIPNYCYDLVFLIHSIFAFNDNFALKKILALPNHSGTIIIVSNSPDSFLAGLKKIIDEYYIDFRYEIDDLIKDLNKQNINYHSYFFETKWSVNMDEEQLYLSTIKNWLSLGRYTSLSNEKQQEIDEYIQQNTKYLDGQRHFVENEIALFIP